MGEINKGNGADIAMALGLTVAGLALAYGAYRPIPGAIGNSVRTANYYSSVASETGVGGNQVTYPDGSIVKFDSPGTPAQQKLILSNKLGTVSYDALKSKGDIAAFETAAWGVAEVGAIAVGVEAFTSAAKRTKQIVISAANS